MRFTHLIASLGILLSSPAFASLQWISHGGNASKTYSLPITTTPDNYRLIWERPFFTNSESEMFYVDDYLIADNKIFYSLTTLDKDRHFHYQLMTVDADSGKTLWTSDQSHSLYLSHHNGKILLDSTADNEKTVAAYDVKSGQIIYTVSMPNKISTFIPFESNMYFSIGREGVGSFDATNARFNWKASLAPGKTFLSGLAVNEDFLIARQFDGVRVFQRSNGQELYKLWIPDALYEATAYQTPTVDDKTAYILMKDDDQPSYCGSASLYALNLSQRSVKWIAPKQAYDQHLVLTKNYIFSLKKDSDAIEAINLTTGEVAWSWAPPSDDNMKSADVVATADTLFIAAKHRIYAVSFSTHQSVWQIDRAAYHLSLGENKLFFLAKDKTGKLNLAAIALN